MSIINNPVIHKSIVSLTDAQIKALPTTPITLVAAPGAGFFIAHHHTILVATFAAAAYTNIDAAYSALASYYLGDFSQWTNLGIVDELASTVNRLTTFLSNTDKIINLPSYSDTPGNGWVQANNVPSTIYQNKALAIAADNNGSGNYTSGNAANTLKVITYYSIETYP